MINQLTVLNTVQANGADAIIDNLGALNITGAGSIPAASVTNVQIIPASAEQIQRTALTFTAANSTVYSFTIAGFAMSTGAYTTKTISFTSAASATQTTISLQAIQAVNNLSDFSVTATNSSGGVTGDASGIVILIGKTASGTNCPDAPIFTVSENDTNIAVTAVATATCAAAPTGGRTAVLEPVFNTSGVMTSIRIIDGGQGYLAAPAITIANGGGAGSAAPTATAVIFEGAVVRVVFTAGTSYTYTTYKGFKVVGTGAALQAKYNYSPNPAQSATSNPFNTQLATLTTGSNYTEIIVDYAVAPIMNTTTYSAPVTTGQISVIVLESATNAALLTSAYGVFANLSKGMSTTISGMVALDGTTAVTTTTYVVATGILTLSAAQSNGVKANDILLVGASPAFANTADTNAIARVLSIASNTSVVCQVGGGNLIAAITTQTLATTLVSRNPIPR